MKINIVKLASYLPNYLRLLKNAIEAEFEKREFDSEIEMITAVTRYIEEYRDKMMIVQPHRLNAVDFSARIKYNVTAKYISVLNSKKHQEILRIGLL